MRRAQFHGQPRGDAPSHPAAHGQGSDHPLLQLQRSAGNRATAQVATSIQRDGFWASFAEAFAGKKGRGGGGRPAAGTIAAAYRRVDYDSHPDADDVINEIATTHPAIAGLFRRRGFVNSCATRLSVALIDAGQSISSPARRVDGGHRWDPGAIQLYKAFRNMWGEPDIRTGQAPSLQKLQEKLKGGKVAVFAGLGHAGIVTETYTDPYVAGYLKRMAFWILEP